MIELEPMGSLVVHLAPEHSWQIPDGPLGVRSTTNFREVVWNNDHFRARSVWANGTYRAGPRINEVDVRMMLRTQDDELIFFQYVGRADLAPHIAGAAPVVSAGRCEAPDPGRFAWLNETHFVGKAMLDLEAGTQTYEMYGLR